MFYVELLALKQTTTAILLFFIFGLCLHATEPRFDHFDMSDGLSQNNIFSLLVDETGYVWAGTLDGLNKYDGYAFEIFRPRNNEKDKLKGSIITALCKGADNNVWIVSRNGGLNRYNAELRIFESIHDSLLPGITTSGISKLCFNNGMLWVQNQRHVGVYKPKTKTFLVAFLDTVPQGIACHSDSSILVYGEFGIKELSFTAAGITSTSVYKEHVYQLSVDTSILALTDAGILMWDKKLMNQRTIVNPDQLNAASIISGQSNAMIRTNNEIWLAGQFPLIRFKQLGDSMEIVHFHYNPEKRYSLKGYVVRELQSDKAGNVWIGTEKHGLNLFDRSRNQFNHLDLVFDELTQRDMDPVRAICKTSEQDLWVGFDQKGVGLIKTDGKQKIFLQYYNADHTTTNIGGVRHIYEDSNGDIWICEQHNLCLYNKSKDRIETVDCRYNWAWPYRGYVVKEFEKGLLTISGGINVGIVNLSTGNLTLLPSSKNGVGIRGTIRDMIYDQYQNLYLAMDDAGILKIDYPNLNYSNISPQTHGLSDSKAYAFASRNDTLWIATNTGLNLYNISQDKITERYFETDGLSNNVLYSLHLYQNELWLSSNRGLGKMDIRSKQFETYLPNDYFMDDAFFFSANHDLYYGGYTGIISFNPGLLREESVMANPMIESFYLLNREVKPGDTINSQVPIKKALRNGGTIKLNYTQNTFSIKLNAFPINFTGKHTFRYKLKGLHNDWIYTSPGVRMAAYTKTNPGKYTFQAQVNVGKEHWSDSFAITINIVPPVWKRLWFKILATITLLILMVFVYRIRLQQIRRRNALLKKTVEEQTAELLTQNQQIKAISEKLHEADQSKLRFFTNISHEFRTPLTLILGQIDVMKNQETKAIRGIRKSALHLLRLINQLIDFRKMELGQARLMVEEFDLVPFIGSIVDSFQVLADKKQIALVFQSSDKRQMIWLDKEKLEKITYNLISNALKYTPENKSVMISVASKENEVEINVSDTGIGIAPEELDHVFDRFFRSNVSANNSGGHGIGLALVKGLTEIQKGRISVESETNEGTTFKLSFKIGRDHFHENEFGSINGEPLPVQETLDDIKHSIVQPGSEILLVEDNEELSNFIQDLLEGHFKLIIAYNGAEALEKLDTHMPELIISDIMMPVMDGMTFCSKVKSNPETSHIPFILLTAKSDLETRIKGFELGIDDYIEKPFAPKLLFARINALLSNREKLRELLFSQTDSKVSNEAKLSKYDKQFWEKINVHINSLYAMPEFNTERLARKLGMSRATLHRKFKGLTGITPGDHIRKVRLKASCQLLENSSLPVNQISDEVGFQSVSHFRKAFKQMYGKTPREHRAG